VNFVCNSSLSGLLIQAPVGSAGGRGGVGRLEDGSPGGVGLLGMAVARLKLADRELSVQVTALVDGNPGLIISQEPEAGLAPAQQMTIELVVGR
jgi:hypothetical protein